MEITEVKIFRSEGGKIRAYANVTFDNCFVVKGFKLVEGEKGLFVVMPSSVDKNGQKKDIAHPINNDTRLWLTKKIIDAYNESPRQNFQEARYERY